jgi:protein-disulfide isomerase
MHFDIRFGPRWCATFALVSLVLMGSPVARADDATDVLSKDKVLRDADIPVLSNKNGDITIVEYFDYQCPFCKKISPVIDEVLKADGKVRFVLKDWPILGVPSPYASQLVLAAKYQDKFEPAHRALITKVGRLTESVIDDTLAGAGVDVTKAKADLAANKDVIDNLLKRNNEQAEAFGFKGTPAFVVGTFRVPGGLTAEQFKLAIADARAAAKKEDPKAK